MKTLFAKDLSFSYINNGIKQDWQNFDFSVKQGEAVSIIGSSGIGKTTLLRVLSGLHKHDKGIVYIDSIENTVQQPKSPIFIVFQEYNMTLLPWLTIEENIELGFYKTSLISKKKIAETLNILFPDKSKHSSILNSFPDQLSGGQKQRIQIARALVSNSDFIFFDEPDTGIDFKSKLSLRQTLNQLAKEQKKGIILITHDLENAYELSNRYYIIHKINEHGKIELIELKKSNYNNLDCFRKKVLEFI